MYVPVLYVVQRQTRKRNKNTRSAYFIGNTANLAKVFFVQGVYISNKSILIFAEFLVSIFASKCVDLVDDHQNAEKPRSGTSCALLANAQNKIQKCSETWQKFVSTLLNLLSCLIVRITVAIHTELGKLWFLVILDDLKFLASQTEPLMYLMYYIHEVHNSKALLKKTMPRKLLYSL